MDEKLFRLINSGMENQFLDWLMPLATDYHTWIPVGVLLIIYLGRKNPKQGALILLVAIAAVAVSDAVNHRILKELFARPRPCITLDNVRLLAGCSGSLSFPSSHAVNSFTIALLLGLFERRLLWVTIPSAAMVAFSRVYVGVHYPVDVTVGAIIGALIGYGSWYKGKAFVKRFSGRKPPA